MLRKLLEFRRKKRDYTGSREHCGYANTRVQIFIVPSLIIVENGHPSTGDWIVLVLYCSVNSPPATRRPQNPEACFTRRLLFLTLCGSGVRLWLSWGPLFQGPLWGSCPLTVGQSSSHLEAGWREGATSRSLPWPPAGLLHCPAHSHGLLRKGGSHPGSWLPLGPAGHERTRKSTCEEALVFTALHRLLRAGRSCIRSPRWSGLYQVWWLMVGSRGPRYRLTSTCIKSAKMKGGAPPIRATKWVTVKHVALSEERVKGDKHDSVHTLFWKRRNHRHRKPMLGCPRLGVWQGVACCGF